ncbi:MAG TPA: hypothetical protein DCY94_03985, partial [Firmicutes bacterium]|nr:hypothetical protein [Bacillota bacterium]
TKDIKKMISHCNEIYLKQLFGKDYQHRSPESLTLTEVVELERLMHKSMGVSEYETKFLDLEMFTKDLPPNTIIDFSEMTSVTKKERRIFDLDIRKLETNCRINTPSSLYLNFFQHLCYDMIGEKEAFDKYYFDRYLREYFDYLESETRTPISVLGTGARNGERILKIQPILPIDRTSKTHGDL